MNVQAFLELLVYVTYKIFEHSYNTLHLNIRTCFEIIFLFTVYT